MGVEIKTLDSGNCVRVAIDLLGSKGATRTEQALSHEFGDAVPDDNYCAGA